MSTHETGGRPPDQPAGTDHSGTAETRAGGDAPRTVEDASNRESRSTGPTSADVHSPAPDHPWEVRAEEDRFAEDPSNRESRSAAPAGGGRQTGPGSLAVDTKTGETLNKLKEGTEAIVDRADQAREKAAAQWEEKLKVVL